VSVAPPPVPTAPGSWVVPVTGGAVGSTTLVRALNERSLLDLLRSEGPASRVDLARVTGLSKPTISAALVNLVEYGLVVEAGAESGKPGPAAVIYEAKADIASVMSIDIGRSWIRLAIADLSGRVCVRVDVANKAKTAAALKGLVSVLIEKALAHPSAGAIGIPDVTVVGGPGIPDEATGSMRVTGTLPGWGKSGFMHELRSSIGGVVLFENDINLAALGEMTHGAAQGLSDFVLVSIGTGIGSGIVVRGELLRGATGAAGELGFLPLGSPRLRPKRDGDKRPTQSVGQFEEFAAAEGIVQAARRAGVPSVDTARDVFEAAERGSQLARQVVNDIGELIGRAITALVVLIDPQVILVTGGVGENLDQLREGMNRSILEYSPSVPIVKPALLGVEAALLGGLTTALPLARDRVFERLTA
jgi:predicted NBD/HSP70 family sugar kinase